MRKKKQETTEYLPQWDTGTYHTGAAMPPKRRSGLVTLLLVAVIFLGGMASAMGILNFRLLEMMSQTGAPLSPLATNASAATNPTGFLQDSDTPMPSIPEQKELCLDLETVSGEMSSQEIYSHNEQSLVSIYCVTYCNENLVGTGIVLSANGYILTNAHLIESAQRIFVYLPDGRLLRAATVGSDPFTDIAVLYVEAQDLAPAIFGSANPLQEDEAVYALKNHPDADHNYILSGNVCRLAELSTGDLQLQVLQSSIWGTTGPMFNEMGQIIGIRAGKITQYFSDNACQEHGIAIPSDTIREIVGKIMADGVIYGRPGLGIGVEAISKLYQHYWELPCGLLVTQIDQDSHAAAAGLEEGDILLTLDGWQLSSRADLYSILYSSNIGDTLTAAVFRDGRRFTISLTVEEIKG